MKPATLVYINKNDETEIQKLLNAIKEKRVQVEELTVSAENIKAEVDLFQHRYNAHIGRYYLELEKVELESKEYRLRLQLRREDVGKDEIEVRVESCFRENRARINASEAIKEGVSEPEIDELPDTEAKYLQILYRKLAKRFHPDKANQIEERDRREQLMPLINRAYHEHDVKILERLSIGEAEIVMQAEDTFAEKRERLQIELRNLNRATSELRSEINRVKAGWTYQLMQQVENSDETGSDLFTNLAADLKRKVKSSRAQLNRLIDMWSRSKNT